MIDRSTDITAALRSRQRGFLLNPFRFGGGGGGGGDPYFSNVKLLLHMDGANGSTTFTDSSGTPKTVTRFGDTQISTAQSKFGGASCLFDGVGDYLTVPAGADFAFGTGDFTAEMWFNPSSVTVYHALFYTGALQTNQLSLRVTDAGKLQSFIDNSFNGYGLQTGTTTLVAGSWHHIAICSASSVIKTFLNGVQQTSATNTYNIQSTTSVYIGAQNVTGTVSFSPTGYIDELRVTKGIARYTANFTPPTAPFPNS